jgi:hypothetical protein
MSEYRKDTELLADILEAIRRIFSYTHGISEQAYYEDDKSQDAVVCNDVVRMTKSRITDPVHFMIRVIPRERLGRFNLRLWSSKRPRNPTGDTNSSSSQAAESVTIDVCSRDRCVLWVPSCTLRGIAHGPISATLAEGAS